MAASSAGIGWYAGLQGRSQAQPSTRCSTFTVASAFPALVELGGHDLAVLRYVLLADDDQVTVSDRRVDHRVAPDAQHEQRPAPDQPPGQHEGLLSQFHGVDGAAGRDLADERYLDLVAIGAGMRAGRLHDRARLPSAPAQPPAPARRGTVIKFPAATAVRSAQPTEPA
jgi:hypothetical protein